MGFGLLKTAEIRPKIPYLEKLSLRGEQAEVARSPAEGISAAC